MSARWFATRRRAIEAAGLVHLGEYPDDAWCLGEMSDPVTGWQVPRVVPWYRSRKLAIEVAALAVLAAAPDRSDRADVQTRVAARRAIDQPDTDVAEAAGAEGLGDLPAHELLALLADVERRLAAHGVAWSYDSASYVRGYTDKLI